MNEKNVKMFELKNLWRATRSGCGYASALNRLSLVVCSKSFYFINERALKSRRGADRELKPS